MLCIVDFVVICKLQNLHYCKSLFGSVRVRTVRSVRFVPSSFKVRVRFGSVRSKVRVRFGSVVGKVLVRFVRFGFGSFPISNVKLK